MHTVHRHTHTGKTHIHIEVSQHSNSIRSTLRVVQIVSGREPKSSLTQKKQGLCCAKMGRYILWFLWRFQRSKLAALSSHCSGEDPVTSSTGKMSNPVIDSIESIVGGMYIISWTIGSSEGSYGGKYGLCCFRKIISNTLELKELVRQEIKAGRSIMRLFTQFLTSLPATQLPILIWLLPAALDGVIPLC